MIPSSLQQVFGTLSVGIFAALVLLAAIWIYRQPDLPFSTWLQKKVVSFDMEAPAAVLLALFLYSFGIVTENLTDHLTDSEPRHWVKAPWWPPVTIATLLGSEQHYRFATLYNECRTADTCELGGLGHAVFSGQKRYVQSHITTPDEAQLALNAESYVTSAESDDDFDKRKAIAASLINRLYYTAKNWAYAQDTHYDELQAIQRHIEFTRSSFVIACWGVMLTAIAAILGAIRWRTKLRPRSRGRPRKLCSARTQSLRVLCTIGLYATIAFFAQQGYGYAEINFNERVRLFHLQPLRRERFRTVVQPSIACCESVGAELRRVYGVVSADLQSSLGPRYAAHGPPRADRR